MGISMLVHFPEPSESRGYSIGFLERGIESCLVAYQDWLSERSVTGFTSQRYENMVDALKALEPLGPIPSKALLLESRGRWTAMVDNIFPYPDPISAVAVLTQKMGCEGVVARNVPDRCDVDGRRITYGATQLEMFSPHLTNFLNYKRTISVAHAEEGWRFDAAGEVQPFEEIARYSMRRVRDRFDEKMLVAYLGAIGIDCCREDWFTGNAALIHY